MGIFEHDTGERSHLTFMAYLNEDFTGGETKFYDIEQRACRATIRPERGMALVFAHLQLHEGAPVLTGRKYVLWTDVMYRQHASSARTPP
jgi:prolyl 4-hydroxylase